MVSSITKMIACGIKFHCSIVILVTMLKIFACEEVDIQSSRGTEHQMWETEKLLLAMKTTVAEQNTKICELEKEIMKLSLRVSATEMVIGAVQESPSAQQNTTEPVTTTDQVTTTEPVTTADQVTTTDQISEIDQTTTPSPRHQEQTFSVALRNKGDYGNHRIPIMYDVIHSNIGNCYSPTDGVFRVKISGLYQLAATASATGSSSVHVKMVVNNIPVLEATAVAWSTGSNMIFKHLKVGDEVWVHNAHGRWIRGGLLSAFSGRLLSPS